MITKTTTGVALLATGLVSSLALAADKHEHHDHGVIFTAKGKETTEIRINGRLQYQYDNLNLEDGATDLSTSNFYFRRLRLGAKATLNDGWYAETVYDFAGASIAIDKAFIGKKTAIFGQKAKFIAGLTKVPFGLEETQSSASIPTIERSAATRFFSDDTDFAVRHGGIQITTEDKKAEGFVYALALGNAYQGDNSKGTGNAEDETGTGIYGRVQYKFDAKNTLVGFDYGSNSGIQQGMNAWTLYGKTTVGDIKLQAEYFSGDIDEVSYDSETNAYTLTASTRMGKWEPVARYSYVETDSAAYDIDFDELIRRSPSTAKVNAAQNNEAEVSSLYLGVNYHVSKSVKYMFGYEMAEAENESGAEQDINGFRARIQLLF